MQVRLGELRNDELGVGDVGHRDAADDAEEDRDHAEGQVGDATDQESPAGDVGGLCSRCALEQRLRGDGDQADAPKPLVIDDYALSEALNILKAMAILQPLGEQKEDKE